MLRSRPHVSGPTINEFLKYGYFGPLNVDNPDIDLIDMLPYVKSGYISKGIYNLLFQNYLEFNGIETIKNNRSRCILPDDVLNYIFGGNIPALYFYVREQNGDIIKMLVSEGIDQGILENPINTFEVLEMLDPPIYDQNGGITGFNRKMPVVADFIDKSFNLNVYEDKDIHGEISPETFSELIRELRIIMDSIKNFDTIRVNKELIIDTSRQRRILPISGGSVKNSRYTE